MFKAAVFSLDSVADNFAKLNSNAWETVFNQFLRRRTKRAGRTFAPFTFEEDYLQYVEGQPRYEAVRLLLSSRGLDLPFGDPSNATDLETVCGLGNRKDEVLKGLVSETDFALNQGAIDLIMRLKAAGVRIAATSPSSNTVTVLQKSRVLDLFDAVVSGIVYKPWERGVKPNIFTAAAAKLGLHPTRCMAISDAISGMTASKRGNFGMVVGVSKDVPGDALWLAGADAVVRELEELSLEEIRHWFDMGLEEDGWKLIYHGFDQDEEKLREALTTVGNGYFGTRGCLEFESAGEYHYPGTYVAGFYDRMPTDMHGRTIHNNDFVNCPNWLRTEVSIGGHRFESPLDMDVLTYRQTLDMKSAVLEWTILARDKAGRVTRFRSKRFASMSSPHLAALRIEITPINYSGRITLRSSIDGQIINDGVARYRKLNQKHLTPVATGRSDKGMWLRVRTTNTGSEIATAARLDAEGVIASDSGAEAGRVWQMLELTVNENVPVTVDKIAAMYTTRDAGAGDPAAEAAREADSAPGFDALLDAHVAEWAGLWRVMDTRIGGDRFVQKVSRLHAYHLAVTASPHNRRIDAGIPARGLHGEAYRGHIFWDSVYMCPFYNMNFPEVTRALLEYRFGRLDGARQLARQHGYSGAMYPWQAADGPDEETQVIHYNPVSGKWDPDFSQRQRHVSIAIFYNVWTYCRLTGDVEFLHSMGAEMMIEIARFWASIAREGEDGRYHIEGVMGPDEYHEKDPTGAEGVTDNAYTNIMTVWLLEQAKALTESLPKDAAEPLFARIGFNPEETRKWEDIERRMNVIIVDGIICQFRGYMELEELDWKRYREKYTNIHRMDRILKAEGDSPDRYKVAKQADSLMAFQLLPADEVARILRSLGHQIDDVREFMRRNYDYYEPRTSHGSTLSLVVFANIAHQIGRPEAAYRLFNEAMESDVYDIQGGTTQEGIHGAVMAGTLWLANTCYAGLFHEPERITLKPGLPSHWDSYQFRISHRGILCDFWINPQAIEFEALGQGDAKLNVPLGEHQSIRMPNGLEIVLDYAQTAGSVVEPHSQRPDKPEPRLESPGAVT